MNNDDTRYVVTIENLMTKKKTYAFASSDLEECRNYILRKHRGCKLARRMSDRESDESLVEKYVHVFNKTMSYKVILMIRINRIVLNDYEEDMSNESTQEN